MVYKRHKDCSTYNRKKKTYYSPCDQCYFFSRFFFSLYFFSKVNRYAEKSTSFMLLLLLSLQLVTHCSLWVWHIFVAISRANNRYKTSKYMLHGIMQCPFL